MTIKIDLKKEGKEPLKLIFNSLKNDGVLVIPTETLYGLSCDYRSKEAIEKINKIKKRSLNKGLILLASDIPMVKKISYLSTYEEKFLLKFWPGGLTALLKPKNLPEWLVFEKRVAVRVTSHLLTNDIIKNYGFPLVSTSLNYSGNSPITNTNDIENFIKKEKLDHDIDAICIDECVKEGLPSTIILLNDRDVKIIRKGAISDKDIFKYAK